MIYFILKTMRDHPMPVVVGIVELVAFAIVIVIILRLSWRRTETDQRRLANDTYMKAIEQLGDSQIEIRIGALYALERIALEERRYHGPIMETLCAYVREKAPWPPKEVAGTENGVDASFVADPEEDDMHEGPSTDIQVILTIIGRRNKKHRKLEQVLDLRGTDLRGANLEKGIFDEALFAKSNMENANMTGIHLKGASLEEADLNRANLVEAHLDNAMMEEACLEEAWLHEARLENADLRGARMEGAFLEEANLEGAILRGAQLSGAKLSGTRIARASFDEDPKDLGAVWDADFPPHGLQGINITSYPSP